MQESISSRDRHLFGPGRKRILALDGGGVRGALSIGFLERLEALLAQRAGAPVRLCDYFDLIGGTSTGSIIAAVLALGMSTKDLKAFYLNLAPKVFRRRPWRIPGWHAKFDAERLRLELDQVLGDMKLGSSAIQTGLGVVLKRVDTGGSWLLVNNPKSPYWETPDDRSFIGNCELRLAKILRASTAAPHYFDPETIEIIDGQPPGLFLDGGLTPHNNPSLALFLAAVLPPIGLNWRQGVDNLTIVSVGTGTFRSVLTIAQARRLHALGLAVNALAGQIAESQRLVMTLMSWLGQPTLQWPIDSEIGDIGGFSPPSGALFRFDRLDVVLDQKWMSEHLGISRSVLDIARLRLMDSPANIPALFELGRQAAEKQLTPAQIEAW
ncbi:MAG: patatin-like phospholipase family protein [Beijerinckiaceae bacterium]|nr:patatin-like phospholipase family protein [Beijerinckiaceae bacterium]